MEEIKMEEIIIKAIDNYFNNVLRNTLKYPERYNITFDVSKDRIILKSNQTSELIKRLLDDERSGRMDKDKLRSKIEQSLLGGFRNKNPNILNVNLYISSNNEIIITFSYGEGPLNLSEIGILSKLVVEYDDDKILELCFINKNMMKACQDPAFWWELIRLKYPQYYKINKEINYNPRKIFKGLRSFINMINSLADSTVSFRLVRNKLYYITLIENFMGNNYETFKYMILESLWKINYINGGYMSTILSNVSFDDDWEKIIKTIINNYSYNILRSYIMDLITFDAELGIQRSIKLNEFLIHEGGKALSIEEILDILVDINQDDDEKLPDSPDLYKYLISKVKGTDYLDEFVSSNPNKDKIGDYILSQIPEDIDIGLIFDALLELIQMGFYGQFEKLYNKFKRKLSIDSRQYLIDEVKRLEDSDEDNYIELLKS